MHSCFGAPDGALVHQQCTPAGAGCCCTDAGLLQSGAPVPVHWCTGLSFWPSVWPISCRVAEFLVACTFARDIGRDLGRVFSRFLGRITGRVFGRVFSRDFGDGLSRVVGLVFGRDIGLVLAELALTDEPTRWSTDGDNNYDDCHWHFFIRSLTQNK